jgi:hypothetical protein
MIGCLLGVNIHAHSKLPSRTFRVSTITSCFSLFFIASTIVLPTFPVPPAIATTTMMENFELETTARLDANSIVGPFQSHLPYLLLSKYCPITKPLDDVTILSSDPSDLTSLMYNKCLDTVSCRFLFALILLLFKRLGKPVMPRCFRIARGFYIRLSLVACSGNQANSINRRSSRDVRTWCDGEHSSYKVEGRNVVVAKGSHMMVMTTLATRWRREERRDRKLST